MFLLANFDDEKKDEDGLYRYLSSAVSDTIIDCLDEYLGDMERYSGFYNIYFGDDFFSGLSMYVKPSGLYTDQDEADNHAGSEFTLAKMKRMKEKMQDQGNYYTFDLFEERVLFLMCSVEAGRSRTAKGRKKREQLKEKVETAKTELREKYRLTVKRANDYSRKMYLASAMLLKEDEDDNLIFWDDDYAFFWRDGFVKGIDYIKAFEGQNSGYGYHHACEIFSDIGLKPPLRLLGTEEANRIANEVQCERFMEKANELLGNIMGAESEEDIRRKYGNDDDLPFS